MIRGRTLVVGLAVVGMLVASQAFSQGAGPGAGRGRGFGGPGNLNGHRGALGLGGPLFNLRGLDLSDAQRQQVQEIRQRSREATEALRERMRQAVQAERGAIEALPVDETRIRAASQALAEVSADVAVQAARMRGEIWTVLTPEQQAQLTTRRTEARERIRERLQRFRERRAERPTQ
jgi:protein CpxP